MEFIAPPLNAILLIRMHINNGLSMRMALREYLLSESDGFSQDILKWYQVREQSGENHFISRYFFRTQVVIAIDRGLRGEPVGDILKNLEQEMIEISKEDIEVHLDKLPLLMLIPMLLFQLPAFLLILVGPIFIQLFRSFGGS